MTNTKTNTNKDTKVTKATTKAQVTTKATPNTVTVTQEELKQLVAQKMVEEKAAQEKAAQEKERLAQLTPQEIANEHLTTIVNATSDKAIDSKRFNPFILKDNTTSNDIFRYIHFLGNDRKKERLTVEIAKLEAFEPTKDNKTLNAKVALELEEKRADLKTLERNIKLVGISQENINALPSIDKKILNILTLSLYNINVNLKVSEVYKGLLLYLEESKNDVLDANGNTIRSNESKVIFDRVKKSLNDILYTMSTELKESTLFKPVKLVANSTEMQRLVIYMQRGRIVDKSTGLVVDKTNSNSFIDKQIRLFILEQLQRDTITLLEEETK